MKYKIGDKVICLPGFNNDSNWESNKSGGSGYKDGIICTVKKIDKNKNYNEVLWFEELEYNGVFSQAVKLYIKEPNYEIY